jgi:hypothetical protein
MSKLQDSLNDRRASEADAGHLCYSAKAQTPGLLVHSSSGQRWVLPWMHFVFGCLREDGDRERLVLTFASHEVVICGTNLGPLAEEAAYLRLETLRDLPEKYAPTGEPFVEQVDVLSLEKGSGTD